MKHDLRKEFIMMENIPNMLPVLKNLKSTTSPVRLNSSYLFNIFLVEKKK